MPSRKKHTNPFLLLIAIAICLVLGVTLRQSNADFSVLSEKPSQSVASVSDSQEQNEPDSDQKSVSPSETATPSPNFVATSLAMNAVKLEIPAFAAA